MEKLIEIALHDEDWQVRRDAIQKIDYDSLSAGDKKDSSIFICMIRMPASDPLPWIGSPLLTCILDSMRMRIPQRSRRCHMKSTEP